mmetsp:Transcript_11910/g.32911  ORF Transcript_11910/g.32911 Transcript_11910/m.32911 type:complete len:241 (-) Transcript_11910:1854-2576(-)
MDGLAWWRCLERWRARASPPPPHCSLGSFPWRLFFLLVQHILSFLELLGHELGVRPLELHERVVGAPLCHHALVHDADLVGVYDRAQPVGHQNDRILVLLALQELIDGLLHEGLALRVEGARCLVQQKELGLAKHHPGDGNPLLLATAQPDAPLPNSRLVSAREARDEIVGIGSLARCDEVLLGVLSLLAAVQNVLLNRFGEHLGLLGDVPHVLVESLQVEALQLPPPDQYLAVRGVVIP